MALSAFDMYSVGIGPSSSHTVGPMRAARRFAAGLLTDRVLSEVTRVHVELYGSLGATGHGHSSPKAVLLGLEGEDPATVDTERADARVDSIGTERRLLLAGAHLLDFDPDEDLVMHRRASLPAHPNGMIFSAYDVHGDLLRERTFYSVGGGFVVDETAVGADRVVTDTTPVKYPFTTGGELLEICRVEGLRVSDVMLANELSWRTEAEVREVDWVNLFALAVNEENASGGRVVTAPTNGAAGIVPAVLHYYVRFVPDADKDGIVRFLLTAAAIGILFKENASISGAEVGCQGEVGSACAMAAGALCEVLGGSPEQVENAAEVGIEHNLGLTCDPVGGLVQIPCIERNAIASMKAINAARLALSGNGSHKVSLDKAIRTMRDTGRDMHTKYKETSRGGLAVNVIEC